MLLPPRRSGGPQGRADRKLKTAFEAARKVGRDILIEIISSKHGPLDDDTVARALTELYDAGLKPDWWKLEPQASAAAWKQVDAVIAERDPNCRGIVLLGLDAPQAALAEGFAAAKAAKAVKGFAVGRTIFADAAKAWFAGRMTDDEAVADMAQRFGALVEIWDFAGGPQSG